MFPNRQIQFAEVLRRIRRATASDRREPLQIVISRGPRQALRTIVLPRALPTVVAISVMVLAIGAAVLGLSSWRLSGVVHGLHQRVVAMGRAAEDIALHPLPDDIIALASASTLSGPNRGEFDLRGPQRLRKPTGQLGRFTIESVRTGARVEAVIDIDTGEPDEPTYLALRHLMRCARTKAEHAMDPRIFQLLYRIGQSTGQKILLISGYRDPIYSTAAFSYHARGMAVDIRVPGMTALMLRDLVRSLGVMGIGYYPKSDFVHADLRDEFYTWVDYGSSGEDEPPEGAKPGS